MKARVKIFMMIFILLISLFGFSGNAEASSARVMISDYEIEGTVMPGGEFKITITLKNTATKTVKNLKLTIYTENGEFYPTEGAGTAYISELASDSEEEFTFSMAASESLEEKSYKLSLKTEYDDYYGSEYTVEESVFIPVSLERKMTFSDIYYDDGVELGETVEITAAVNNTGRGTIYNVQVMITGDNVYDQTSYVGNIESGDSGTVDILTKSKKIYEDTDTNVITISYEDADGNVTKQEFDIGAILIEEPQYDNLEKLVTENTESSFKTYFKEIIIGVVVVLVIGFYIYMKYRRKKKISEEF